MNRPFFDENLKIYTDLRIPASLTAATPSLENCSLYERITELSYGEPRESGVFDWLNLMTSQINRPSVVERDIIHNLTDARCPGDQQHDAFILHSLASMLVLNLVSFAIIRALELGRLGITERLDRSGLTGLEKNGLKAAVTMAQYLSCTTLSQENNDIFMAINLVLTMIVAPNLSYNAGNFLRNMDRISNDYRLNAGDFLKRNLATLVKNFLTFYVLGNLMMFFLRGGQEDSDDEDNSFGLAPKGEGLQVTCYYQHTVYEGKADFRFLDYTIKSDPSLLFTALHCFMDSLGMVAGKVLTDLVYAQVLGKALGLFSDVRAPFRESFPNKNEKDETLRSKAIKGITLGAGQKVMSDAKSDIKRISAKREQEERRIAAEKAREGKGSVDSAIETDSSNEEGVGKGERLNLRNEVMAGHKARGAVTDTRRRTGSGRGRRGRRLVAASSGARGSVPKRSAQAKRGSVGSGAGAGASSAAVAARGVAEANTQVELKYIVDGSVIKLVKLSGGIADERNLWGVIIADKVSTEHMSDYEGSLEKRSVRREGRINKLIGREELELRKGRTDHRLTGVIHQEGGIGSALSKHMSIEQAEDIVRDLRQRAIGGERTELVIFNRETNHKGL